MKVQSFLWTLLIGSITLFLVVVTSLGWIVTHSSINLLKGGVYTFPQAAMFIPKQAPAMVSLLTNPEKLNALRQVSLPLARRNSDRQEWQAWETSLFEKVGFDYQRDIKPWLGEELTSAIATLDYDRNSSNGVQPGYLIAAATKDNHLAEKTLSNFLSTQQNLNVESYQGVNIVSSQNNQISTAPTIWANAVVGDFVLFANHPEIIKTAINQAQAINRNLQQSESYQTALSYIKRPHLGVAYFNIIDTTAWLDKSVSLPPQNWDQILSISLSINPVGINAESTLITNKEQIDSSVKSKSFLNNPELQQIFNSLPFDRHNATYIDLKTGTSLLEAQIPLYKVSKLALQSLLPHLNAIAMKHEASTDNVERYNIQLKLDA
ncbi:hypothetical protein NIES4102_16450 [Chondrocystis sp. NIES-4102]|nr:hypothetical protein NIES4102_16450 [Chondrocystis sp. NIES-4102]